MNIKYEEIEEQRKKHLAQLKELSDWRPTEEFQQVFRIKNRSAFDLEPDDGPTIEKKIEGGRNGK